MSDQSRAAIHLAPPPVGQQLKACVSRAKALGCRVVAITDADVAFANSDDHLLDRLVEGEFDLVILRVGVAAIAADEADVVVPAVA